MKRIVFFTMTLLSMAQGAWSQGKGDETFPSWNACESLTTLTDFECHRDRRLTSLV